MNKTSVGKLAPSVCVNKKEKKNLIASGSWSEPIYTCSSPFSRARIQCFGWMIGDDRVDILIKQQFFGRIYFFFAMAVGSLNLSLQWHDKWPLGLGPLCGRSGGICGSRDTTYTREKVTFSLSPIDSSWAMGSMLGKSSQFESDC